MKNVVALVVALVVAFKCGFFFFFAELSDRSEWTSLTDPNAVNLISLRIPVIFAIVLATLNVN